MTEGSAVLNSDFFDMQVQLGSASFPLQYFGMSALFMVSEAAYYITVTLECAVNALDLVMNI